MVGGRLHFLLKPHSGKRRKEVKTKEIIVPTDDQDIRNVELYYEVEKLKEKNFINSKGDELIKF